MSWIGDENSRLKVLKIALLFVIQRVRFEDRRYLKKFACLKGFFNISSIFEDLKKEK